MLPLVLLMMCGVLFAQALEFPASEDVGSAAVPFMWMGFAVAFSLMLVFQAIRQRGKPDPIPGRIGFVILFALWLFAYLAAVEPIGYFTSTFAFLMGSMFAMGYRRLGVMVVVSIGWLVFSYFIFLKLLYISLPIGPLLAPLLE
ncbi:membrane protein of unknown function [Magnetospira sp. QH-2]|nr:membrane protein of unknown function [Magnetospira sp. QH-2]